MTGVQTCALPILILGIPVRRIVWIIDLGLRQPFRAAGYVSQAAIVFWRLKAGRRRRKRPARTIWRLSRLTGAAGLILRLGSGRDRHKTERRRDCCDQRAVAKPTTGHRKLLSFAMPTTAISFISMNAILPEGERDNPHDEQVSIVCKSRSYVGRPVRSASASRWHRAIPQDIMSRRPVQNTPRGSALASRQQEWPRQKRGPGTSGEEDAWSK